MGHGKRGVFCSRVLAERVGHAFWLVCAGLPARGAARSFGPGGRRCPESGDARLANGAGTRTTEMPAVVRSGAGLTKEQKRERVQLKNSSRVEKIRNFE